MSDVKDALSQALEAKRGVYRVTAYSIAAVAVCLCGLVLTVTSVVGGIPGEIRATRAVLVVEVQATRAALLAEVDRQASGIRADSVGQIVALRNTLDNRLGSLQSDLNIRVGEALRIADSRAGEATGAIVGLRGDLAPTLAGAAALVGHVDQVAASDDIPGALRDTRFLMARSARTMGHIEQAAQAAEKATPEISASVVGIGKSSDSIAANVAREVDEATKPKRWWQKILGPVYTVGRLVAAFL